MVAKSRILLEYRVIIYPIVVISHVVSITKVDNFGRVFEDLEPFACYRQV